MIRTSRVLLLIALLFAPALMDSHLLHAATCTGSTPCNVCKNCSSCGYCAKRGGTCGVCKRGTKHLN
jgi:hypothetical protein